MVDRGFCSPDVAGSSPVAGSEVAMVDKKKLHIIQHALGLDRFGQGAFYRNHFVLDVGCNNYQTLQSLVEEGLMTESERLSGSDLTGGGSCFYVTEKGRAWVIKNSPHHPKTSKAKERYRRYLDCGECFESFIAFCRYDAQRLRDERARWD